MHTKTAIMPTPITPFVTHERRRCWVCEQMHKAADTKERTLPSGLTVFLCRKHERTPTEKL